MKNLILKEPKSSASHCAQKNGSVNPTKQLKAVVIAMMTYLMDIVDAEVLLSMLVVSAV